jgi:hypothetical protein
MHFWQNLGKDMCAPGQWNKLQMKGFKIWSYTSLETKVRSSKLCAEEHGEGGGLNYSTVPSAFSNIAYITENKKLFL